MTPAEVSKAANSLSVGQVKAMLGLPEKRDFIPYYSGFQWPTVACLKSKALVRAVHDGVEGWGPKALHRLSMKGHAVRQYLLEKSA